ncbi:conserved hypothetical protein [Ancylobacter novellus DSM 506]|uniref:Uncharacterized protein n=1 Tax=Ancylobacter novellus (strain ATCC 8093 / DSM 506 / JCM 20403 / CCM 1077 / IAM 12100 / NBRC 12443 / NCIMB 10456) TaxID=639283 RepID=D6ZZV6_ANCN5|nr:hypothetical protein [Ancylobacter novellus]ADH87370.1 conserved hypothetical protein [Ancylobacter novellus DSM 506]
MRLIPNWRKVLLRAWSVRLGLIAGLFEGLNVVLQITVDRLPDVSLGLRLAAGGCACLALVSRFIAQPKTIGESHADH